MRKIFLALIKTYQNYISPLSPPSCRFYPTCSEYSYQSIQKHGILKGSGYSIIRISKCHPFHPGGIDLIK